MAQTVAVIDYGMGNLHSVASALAKVGGGMEVAVTADAATILGADRVVFPGVGAIRDCMAEIRRLQLDAVVREVLQRGRPLLGICIGMQVLLERSEENAGVDCLGLIAGKVAFLGDALQSRDGERLKVPHMGWSQVRQSQAHPLWQGIPDQARFYFVHSYYVHAQERGLVAGTVDYGVTIDAALARDNLFAVQFHPEKSAEHGLRLLQNFLTWKP
ncbi:MAG TPA: imidazole glycerol phosphate synthase subunit HisH [Spongiibacteraceae bacterium]|jgi:glutamine amidotransferase|nr:imidazole glycerol phosphate synthase subunit HisH [Spongiibacteraceae bacterium]HUH37527.1 imidazole glycerol phosphate synthase subunit HisH [Spongiibacteraceae bacterium]